MTIIYLIRHSVRLPLNTIENYNTNQNKTILNEKIILSPLGEERAKLLSEKAELQNIDVVYTSNCVRTLATAKYLMNKQNLKANIDDRLDERRIGKPNYNLYRKSLGYKIWNKIIIYWLRSLLIWEKW